MVNLFEQGDIIYLDFNPQTGHEQKGKRPAIIVTNNLFNKYSKMLMVCPITNTNNHFPLHIPLDERTKTSGVILCEHIKALDLNNRKYQVIEKLPNDIMTKIINIVYSEIEIIK